MSRYPSLAPFPREIELLLKRPLVGRMESNIFKIISIFLRFQTFTQYQEEVFQHERKFLPEICNLILQKYPKPFLNLLKFFLFFMRDTTDAIRSKVITVVIN